MMFKIFGTSLILLALLQLIIAAHLFPRNQKKTKQKLLQRAGIFIWIITVKEDQWHWKISANLRYKLNSNESLPISDDLKSFLSKLQTSKSDLRSELVDPDEYEYACSLCSTVMEDLLTKRRILQRDEEYFRKYVTEMCVQFDFQTPEVCKKMIDLNLVSINKNTRRLHIH